MKAKIWKELAQILYFQNGLVDIIKPFFENLNNNNINDERNLPLLKTFSRYQLEILYKEKIIPESNHNESNNDNSNNKNIEAKIEEIISGDKIKELQEFIQEKDINTYNTITKSFNEVKKMKIPLIQYCIMKKAIECFKYLLVNGFDDPNRTMEEESNTHSNNFSWNNNINNINQNRYKWDCIATALYFRNKEIVKILEVKGIEKGKKSSHIEAALLSYQNAIAEEMIENIKEDKKNILSIALLASSKNNNIQGTELLISKGANINSKDIYFLILVKYNFLLK